MAYHGILIPENIVAMNVDAYNRSVRSSASALTDIDNGFVLLLAGKSTVADENEVFLAGTPATGSLSGLWMAYDAEIVLTDGRFRMGDPDIRNFTNPWGKVFSAYKPQVGDIITLTADALGGSYSAGSTTHISATNGTMKLTWGTSQTADVLSYKFLYVNYISLATGGIDSQRHDAYQFECVAI